MKTDKRASLIRAIGLFSFVTTQSSFAETTKSVDFPPVERASFHQLVFADEDLSVLNNLYPPGGESGFHAHYRDVFYVVIQPGQGSSVQKRGGH